MRHAGSPKGSHWLGMLLPSMSPSVIELSQVADKPD